jgi:hypothetical protein
LVLGELDGHRHFARERLDHWWRWLDGYWHHASKVPLSALGIGAPAGVPALYKLAIQNKSGTFARVEYFQQIEFSAN